MNLFRTRKLFGIDQQTRIHHPRVCRMSTKPPVSGNQPELAVHLRMNFRSEQRVSYNVRAPIAFHLLCIAFLCFVCFVFIVSPPLFYCPVVSTIAADAPVFDYFVDDRTPTIELPGKQCPFTSPIYRLSVYIYLLHEAFAAAAR